MEGNINFLKALEPKSKVLSNQNNVGTRIRGSFEK
jgi:hypothetical protein